MGQRGRTGAARRLALAIDRGEAPTELRSLLVHGPIRVPVPEGEGPSAFDLMQTRPHVRVEAEIANDGDDEGPTSPVSVAELDAGDAVIEEVAVAPARSRRRAPLFAAAALALLVGGLAAVVLQPQASAIASASSALAASFTDRSLLAEPAPLQPWSLELGPAPVDDHAPPGLVDAKTVADDETIIVLDDPGPRRSSSRSRRAGVGARERAGRKAPAAEGLVRDAASALEAGSRGHAIELYERALSADPGLSDAAAKLSSVYFDLGRFDLATAYAERAVKTDFDNPEYHVLLGDAYYRNRALEDARSQWQTAAKLGSNRARQRLAKLD